MTDQQPPVPIIPGPPDPQNPPPTVPFATPGPGWMPPIPPPYPVPARPRIRIPGSVVAAVGIATVLALLMLFESLHFLQEFRQTDSPEARSSLIWAFALTLLLAFAALGCAQGWILGQIVTVTLGGGMTLLGLYLVSNSGFLERLAGIQDYGYMLIVVGALLAGLVLVPQSSRTWFYYVH